MLRHQIVLLLVATCLLVGAAGIYTVWLNKKIEPAQLTQSLSNYFDRAESLFNGICADSSLIGRLATRTFTEADNERLKNVNLSLLVYPAEGVSYWNNRHLIIPDTIIYGNPEPKMLTLLNDGLYLLFRCDIANPNPDLPPSTLFGGLLLQNHYLKTNQYLVNKTNNTIPNINGFSFSVFTADSLNANLPNAWASLKIDKQFLLINLNETEKTAATLTLPWWWMTIVTLGFLVLLLVIWRISNYIKNASGFLLGFLSLGLMFVLLFRWIFLKYFNLFAQLSPKLLEKHLACCWAGLFAILTLYIYVNREDFIKWTTKHTAIHKWLKPLVMFCLVIFSFFASGYLSYVINKENIYFAQNLYGSFNVLVLLNFILLSLLIYSFALVTLWLLTMADGLKTTWHEKIIYTLIGGAFSFLLFFKYYSFVSLDYTFFGVTLAWLFLYVLSSPLFIQTKKPEMGIMRAIIFSSFISFFVTCVVWNNINYLENNNCEQFLSTVIREQDPLTESLFQSQAIKIIAEDNIIRNYFSNHFMLPRKELEDRIRKIYLNDYFNQYKINVYRIQNGINIDQQTEGQNLSYEEKLDKFAIPTQNTFLFQLINPKTGNYDYIAKLPVWGDEKMPEGEKLLGSLIIEMSKIQDAKSKVYPELLISDSLRNTKTADVYSYAIYRNGLLSTYDGSFPYEYKLSNQFLPITNNLNASSENKDNAHYINEKYYYNTLNYSHLITHQSASKTVIVTINQNVWLNFIVLFAYLFCGLGIFSMLHSFSSYLATTQPVAFKFSVFRDIISTINFRINTYLIGLLLLVLFVIGVFTLLYLFRNIENQHKTNLAKTRKDMVYALQRNIDNYNNETENPSSQQNDLISNAELQEENEEENFKDSTTDFLETESNYGNNTSLPQGLLNNPTALQRTLTELAAIHGHDINLYDTLGMLIQSSVSILFEEGLVSNRMQPEAYLEMKRNQRNQLTLNEKIGELNYLAAYLPIKNREGNAMAYAHLPYFEQNEALRTQKVNFFVAIVNFFVVLLVLSATIAIALARSITNPINMIRDKLDQLRLGQRNEKLIYNRKDEIGSLVDQYNRTIDLLEDSVQRLQDAERINAWQDFAKQVAHEIKNPLTPMKLSIQHLQKAIVEKRQDVNQLASRVTNTLIEQIDLLAHIASEFSSFAKMPAPINEKLNLNELLTTGLDVFEVNQTISLTKKLPDEPLTVYADRQQLLRVFNNLIKNAIQAIPNDRKGEVNILLETTENNEFALVSVNDNGVGIPEEQKEKVFLPNFTTKSSGMGIGLSMAKNMIQEAGGQIWLNSTMGIGSTFYVKLPLFKQGEPTQPKSSET